MIFKKFLKIIPLLVIISFYSNIAYACMFSYNPPSLIDKHDLIFTAKAGACNETNEGQYINFAIQKIWKGKPQPNYKVSESCKKNRFRENSRYLVVANYKDNSDLIEIPFSKHCNSTIQLINMDIFGFAPFIIEMIKYGHPEIIYEVLTTPPKPNWKLGEPLQDYRTFRYDENLFTFYAQITVIALILGLTAFCTFFPLYLFWKRKRRAKN